MTIALSEDRRGVTRRAPREHDAGKSSRGTGVAATRPGRWSLAATGDLAWIDQARGTAAIAVVVLHVAARVVGGVPDVTSFAWWVGNIVDSAMRWCVPVFVMISGALLLDPEKPVGSFATFYARRVSRLCWPLLFWSGLFLIWNGAKHYLKYGLVDPGALVGVLVSGRPHYHLWYLYMLIGLYLFAPFARLLLQQLDLTRTMWLGASVFFLASVSALHHRVVGLQGGGLFVFWFLPYISYFIAGGVVRRWRRPISTLGFTFVLLSAIALTAIGCHVVAVRAGVSSGLYFYDYFSVTVIPMAIAAFLVLRILPPTRLLVGLAPLSLGVYLVHPLFIEGLPLVGFGDSRFNPLWAIPAKAALVLLLSLISVSVIRRIPLLRRVV